MQNIIVQTILENYLFIAFVFSILVGLWGPAKVTFADQSERHQKIYNMWMNFVSATIGWISLYVFITFFAVSNGVGLSLNHILLIVIAVLGIVGFLPNTLVAGIDSIKTFFKKG